LARDGLLFGVEQLERRDGAEDLLLHDVRGDVLDLEECGAVERSGGQRGVGRYAAAHDRRRVREGLLDHAVDARDRRLVDQRAHVGIRVQAVADANALEISGQPRANLVRDATLNEDPRARHAELPGERRDACRQQRDGAVEVGVVEDDRRRLAAELEVHPLQGRGAVGGDDPPDRGAPGVADDLDLGRGDEVGRVGVPGLREEVDHAARQRLDLGEDLRHAIGDQRRLSRHLDRDSVPCRQRRSDRINRRTGEFHGTITATTPAGSAYVLNHCPGATSAAIPVSVSACPAQWFSVTLGSNPSIMPSESFLPFSIVTSRPSSSAWASKRSAISLSAR
jgi:hypothetical protein